MNMPKIIESFLALNNAKKVTYIVMLGAGLWAVAALFNWASQPQYQVLYSNLSQDDAASIVEELQSRRIPYRVGGGGVVSVPQDKIYETRLQLAGTGLPKGGGVGFEIFDKTGFGVSEFTQKINYLRAIQGELSRTIGWLSEIETARVHIVVPERKIFLDDEDKTSASVVVKLRGGRRLKYNQVQGIVHLVSSSVMGLHPQNVTIVDTEGNMLTKPMDGDGVNALTSSQLEYQRGVEKDIERRIKGILEPVVGIGKVKASASVDIDFKRVEKTEERFDPDSVAVRSEQRNKENFSGAGAALGVPGVLSNTSKGGAGGSKGSSPSRSNRQNEVINYEISKVLSKIVEPSGVIKRMSVAVLVDGRYKDVENPKGEKTKEYSARSDEEIKKFEGLIKNAIGFVAERGDAVQVVNIPFETQSKVAEDVQPVAEPGVFQKYLPSIIRYGVITFLSLLLFLLVLRPLINGLNTTSSSAGGSSAEGALPDALRALEEGIEQKALSPAMDIKKRVVELVKENPKQAAQILKTWVKEK